MRGLALLFGLAFFVMALPARAQEGSFQIALVGYAERAPVPSTGIYLLLELPFERLLAGRARMAPSAAKDPAPVPTAAAPPTLSLPLARRAVAQAWSAAGLDGDERLDGMARRARWSALLPEVRLRMLRSDRRTDVSGDDGVRSDGTYGATEWYEARVGLKLDRLLFADEELAIERLRVERSKEREELAAKVVVELGRYARARLDENDPARDDSERGEAVVRELEAAMMLDVLTGGWFSRWLEGER
jgi:hypothetical protein